VTVSLEDWLASGWLVEHEAGRDEIANLLAIADRDLDQCALQELVPDWLHNIAYTAALQLASAALVACGYRASREVQHFRVLQSLAHTVGSDPKTIRRLDRARKRRNFSAYDTAGMITEHEAVEVVAEAKALRDRVVEWLEREHPHLV
jgi:uncharacterized protein (UPF0332 family)